MRRLSFEVLSCENYGAQATGHNVKHGQIGEREKEKEGFTVPKPRGSARPSKLPRLNRKTLFERAIKTCAGASMKATHSTTYDVDYAFRPGLDIFSNSQGQER